MNTTLGLQPDTTTPVDCLIYYVVGGVPQHFSTQVYTILVIDIIILVATCPFTVVFNLLTMVAVKMKVRLQSMSNIALACLATTDLMVGVLGQPIVIAVAVSALQSQATDEVCRVQHAAKYLVTFFVFSSLLHLAVMSADRYLAIKRSYSYEETVTKTRVLIASAIAWAISLAMLILHFLDHELFLRIQSALAVVLMLSIAICSIVVYCEARRQEKLIAALQVSVEARERFLKERRALRLTITIVVMLILSYLPIIAFRIIRLALKDKVSLGVLYALYTCASSLALLNSLVNPLIYSVRLRQFRVAFIEILLRKTRVEAEEFEMRLFGSENAMVNLVPNQGGEGEERNVNQVNENIAMETNQGGERGEENVNQLNENIAMETNQAGKGEEQNVNQVNENIAMETNQAGKGEEQNVNQVNENNVSKEVGVCL